METVNVYEFVLPCGTIVGCGTELELSYWKAEGVMVDERLGEIIGKEPAHEDDRRRKAWGIA